MAPPASRGAATRAAPAPAGRSGVRLDVVRHQRARRVRQRRRLAPAVSALMIAGSLVAVVVADGVVAQDQIRLTSIDQQLATASAQRTSMQTAIAEQTAPPVVVQRATTTLGMVLAPQVTDLPGVSLAVPLPTPNTGATGSPVPKR